MRSACRRLRQLASEELPAVRCSLYMIHPCSSNEDDDDRSMISLIDDRWVMDTAGGKRGHVVVSCRCVAPSLLHTAQQSSLLAVFIVLNRSDWITFLLSLPHQRDISFQAAGAPKFRGVSGQCCAYSSFVARGLETSLALGQGRHHLPLISHSLRMTQRCLLETNINCTPTTLQPPLAMYRHAALSSPILRWPNGVRFQWKSGARQLSSSHSSLS